MLLLPQLLHAGSVPLLQVAEELDLQLQWDAVSSRGTLVRGDTYLGFFPGVPFAAVNYQRTIPIDPVSWDSQGGLLVTPETREIIERLFPPPAEQPPGRISTVFIDPGHGGKDPGAIGRHTVDGTPMELREKDVVLDVSLRLARLLRQRNPEIDIVMSREDDRYIELIDRYEMANDVAAGANDSTLFVSIHANASINTRAQGFEVWYLPPEFRRTLITEADYRGSEEIVPILNTMMEEELTIQSILLGRHILSGLEGQLGSGVPNRGLKQETFAVVRGAHMPSVLVEIGFLTNSEEFRRLQDSAYLQEIAEGIYNGLNEFIKSY
ncbi:N-acetylmuramoyl-L-alanine amidase family protein [Spirochaeta africana]|uniref:N-acetylmuramoyl-L-alanine amidase family protein n=1 Tax=Spirochaeta africana TaxID=46355 RepID=UPI00030E2162|nr:N-acetylmuramoyl-L-alanine amidase [Spirochaeta africana]